MSRVVGLRFAREACFLRRHLHRRAGHDRSGFIGDGAGESSVGLAVQKLADRKDSDGKQRTSFHHDLSPHIGRSHTKSDCDLHFFVFLALKVYNCAASHTSPIFVWGFRITVSQPGSTPPTFRVADLIRRKRDGGALSRSEIDFLVDGCTRGDVPDYQIAAWLMAVVLRGMTGEETASLTNAMLHSGEVLDLSFLPGKKVDKHSTGGVGDKTSLVLAPLVAAAGLYVPMVSGRGLGHTGGTLDKLESIPGFRVGLTVPEFHRVLETCGCSMIGQTERIAPADRKLYALRDVTGTVESPYLICASIMSKKLAEGTDALVFFLNTGSGAFMKKEEDAVFLAELMVETGERMGKQMVALITNMDQPLGRMVGNALEVVESIEVLQGGGPRDLRELCLELAAWMFFLGDASKSVAEGRQLA